MKLSLAALVLFAVVPGVAQRGPTPTFQVVSIQPIPRPAVRHPYAAARAVQPGGRYYNRFTFLYQLVVFAYPQFASDRTLVGLPSWGYASGDYFSVECKSEPGTSPSIEQMRLMMRSALANRFGLRFHVEDRRMPVFLLQVAKGGTRGIQPSDRNETSMYPVTLMAIASLGATARAVTMHDIASLLSESLSRPVVDRTGMQGTYDFDVPPPAERSTGAGLTDPESFFTALPAKLGLTLETAAENVPVMVVEHVAHPTPN